MEKIKITNKKHRKIEKYIADIKKINREQRIKDLNNKIKNRKK